MHAPRAKRESLLQLANSKMGAPLFLPLTEHLLKEDYAKALACLQEGSPIREKNKLCYSPLHLAAWAGSLEVAKILIEKGAIYYQHRLTLP